MNTIMEDQKFVTLLTIIEYLFTRKKWNSEMEKKSNKGSLNFSGNTNEVSKGL